LWEKRDPGDITPLFANYQAWLEASILPQFADSRFALHRSHFPGDLSLVYHAQGKAPLLLVGLNSAWMQFQAGDMQGRLELPLEQFHAALGPGGLGRFAQAPQALLMMHHPLDWLSPAARNELLQTIYTPGRFAACLHGHMHRGRSESVSISGGEHRHWLQAPSLFGLEHYGSAGEERAMGYAWGELNAQGQLRIWPLRRVASGGRMGLLPDQAFSGFPAVIRPAAGAPEPAPAQPPRLDLRSWLEETLAHTGHIDIRGIGSGAGRVRSASRYPIERLYTQLRCRSAGLGDERDQGLEALLPGHRLLLIEGQPGAGKTTFLRFTAALLARDGLGLSTPRGATWRETYLGMDPARPVPVPVFLRLAMAAGLLGAPDPRRPDDRRRLPELILPNAGRQEWAAWQDLLEQGRVLLLLDGMDEVADPSQRDRLLSILRDLVQHCKQTRMVLTSRPIDTRPLVEMGFSHTGIESFSADQVEGFIDHWVGALYNLAPGEQPDPEAGGYRTRLLAAITERPRLRRLAANPVMLTCLCVVHWNEGGLPDARVRLYRAVLHWLRTARAALRQALGVGEAFAERAFPTLALAMMETEGGRQTLFDLEEAAEALLPLAERDFPALTKPERLHLLRDWLNFECTGSGIIEELGNRRLRYWHLTFQEYLAARALAWLGDGDGAADWWPQVRPHLDDPQWRETVELLPGCLLDEGGQRRVDRLLERVIGLLDLDPGLADRARVAGIMGRLLEPLGAYGYRPAPALDRELSRLLGEVMAIFEPAGAAQVPVQQRIAAAEALGRGGDPRLVHGQDNLIEVPGPTGWSLGKYPVTVEEYRAFVEDGGYAEPRWWDAVGWQQRDKEGWEAPGSWDEQLATPNRPVVAVSWFEAEAYCTWLAGQWQRPVRLPDGDLWQRAAQGEDGRKYPWGDEEPDPERANFAEAFGKPNVGRPTPVGIYPAGNGPYGHCDLAGNVWEWCADVWPEENLAEDWRGTPGEVRMLRGGGWDDPADRLQAASRYGSPAGLRSGVIGFRVAVAPASLGP